MTRIPLASDCHEISVTDSGVAEFMSANTPAWHGLGQTFDENGNSAPDSATAMQLAHLGWKVGISPAYHLNNYGYQEIEGQFVTFREDTGEPLGVVKGRYKVQQNSEAFSFLDSLLQDGVMKYETAFAMQGGKKIVLLARMPSLDTFAPGDIGYRYIALSTSHDGTGAINLLPTSVRMVCRNTKRMGINIGRKEGVICSVRHTANMGERLDIAKGYLSQFDKAFTQYAAIGQVLATRQYTLDQSIAYIEALYPKTEKEEGRGATMRGNKVKAVRAAMLDAPNVLNSIKGSWWALFNSVTQTVDHGAAYKGSARERAENRFISTIDGNGADFKDKAFSVAVQMAGVDLASLAG